MMELKDFVSETVKQIIEGVTTAQEFAKEAGARVNPAASLKGITREMGLLVIGMDRIAQVIEFDVVVSATDSEELRGGLGVFVAGVGIGTQGQLAGQSSAVNRIRFSLPIQLPHQD